MPARFSGRPEIILRIPESALAGEIEFALTYMLACNPPVYEVLTQRRKELCEAMAAMLAERAGKELAGMSLEQVPAGKARTEFLAASIAVWREIDRLDAEPDGYHPIRMSVELRQRERAAWERYRDLLDARPDRAVQRG